VRRLRGGEWIALAGAIVLVASLWLHWYGTRAGLGEQTGWQAFGILDVVLVLLALVPVALAVTQATRASPALPTFFSVMTVVAGVLAALLILIRIVAQPGPNALVTVQAGAWAGFAAAVVVAAGGWRSTRVESMPGVPAPPVREMPAPAP
jgi:drug/metabolite transporter (DMT)-like permease